jgi:hypothetical protein
MERESIDSRTPDQLLGLIRKKLLVVDENLEDLLYYSAVLQHQGYEGVRISILYFLRREVLVLRAAPFCREPLKETATPRWSCFRARLTFPVTSRRCSAGPSIIWRSLGSPQKSACWSESIFGQARHQLRVHRCVT